MPQAEGLDLELGSRPGPLESKMTGKMNYVSKSPVNKCRDFSYLQGQS
jgi:hypothetical protein